MATITTGCSPVTEGVKKFWGSSTRALEDARVGAEKESFPCAKMECFDAVVEMACGDTTQDPPGEPVFSLFIENRARRMLVLMKIPGAIDTTEVGVFFTPQEDGRMLVEVSSLSTYAKKVASEKIFEELGARFPLK